MRFSTILWSVFLTLLLPVTSEILLPRSRLRTQAQTKDWKKSFEPKYVTQQGDDSTQAPLLRPVVGQAASTVTKKTATLEIERYDLFGWPFYFTSIAIGTPPQPFTVFIDLDFGGAFVRSVNCGDDCGAGIFAYNHSASSSSDDLSLRFGAPLSGHTAQGAMYNDKMHIVSVPLPNASLGATDTLYGENILVMILADLCDGALGFAPPNRTSAAYLGKYDYGRQSWPNFLYELTSSGVLERNIMTLSLPKSRDVKGKLTLGMVRPPVKYRIPLSRQPTPPLLEGAWTVDLSHILINGLQKPLEIPLDIVVAVTLAPDFLIALPFELTETIYDYLGARASEDVDGGIIDCDIREDLPDIKLTLGNQAITLGWRDYSGILFYGPDRICVVEVQRLDYDQHSAILGQWLLRKFDTAFDMERAEIGCELNDLPLVDENDVNKTGK